MFSEALSSGGGESRDCLRVSLVNAGATRDTGRNALTLVAGEQSSVLNACADRLAPYEAPSCATDCYR